ncbi:hypothetical protein SAMN05216428_102387 [Nitrosospira sp. Nsp11]|uniref:hypothetical protein n=1 Tax=Nitrosospira sp. Nsp11 TaxID=1855338 RepID=UPI000912B734|nr:hypothetical protein [Nitrosospira sp. Nsp11]SHL43168.1 hypothetical protein SAMN05216428_102387 [Nitrosospira sp. Nsp11]
MANVLNRTTNEFRRSVHEPNYPAGEWIINPNLAAVEGFESKYWIITGDTVTLMDQAARNAVDLAELETQRDAIASMFTNPEDVLRAFMRVVLNEFNAHADFQNQILNGIRTATSLADLKAKATAKQDYPDRTVDDLITAIRNNLGS